MAVAIDIRKRDCTADAVPQVNSLRRGKVPVAVARKCLDFFSANNDQVQVAIAIEIGECQSSCAQHCTAIVDRESTVAMTEQHVAVR